jgi:hypothetical protein
MKKKKAKRTTTKRTKPMSAELRVFVLLYQRLTERDQERFINSVVGRHGTWKA